MVVEIEIFCPLFETEDRIKVEQALRNLIPLPKYSIKEIAGQSHLYGKTSGINALKLLYKKLREQRILDASRKVMKQRDLGNLVSFCVHKQTAVVGKISFCQPEGESPLGAITIKITSPQLESVVNWLAPYTREGKEVKLNNSITMMDE
ncbi:MAG: RNA-binding domain-containing protein [Candidatus Heimdallarchaeota archaeon]